MPLLAHPLLYVAYLAAFCALIMRSAFFAIENTSRRHLLFFFLLKVAAGVGLTLIYTYYYTDKAKADIWRYFNDSCIISPLLFTQPLHWFKIMSGIGINDPDTFQYLLSTQYFSHPGHDMVTNNTFIIRVNVLLNYLSFRNIFINTLFFNFISFAALTALFKALRPYFQPLPQVLYVPLFLLPAVLFWGAGLLKESILFTGVSLYLYALLTPANRSTNLLLIGGFILLALTKLQVALLALVCFTLFMGLRKKAPAANLRLAALVAGMALVYALAGDKAAHILLAKRNEFIELALKENAGSYMDARLIEPTAGNLIALLPEAFVNAVLRPFLWDAGKAFQKIFGLENLLFLVLLIAPLRYFKLPTGQGRLLCFGFATFALLNYLVIGITVPIIGAIVHYRIIATPFLLLTVLLCVDLEKVKAALPFKR